MTTKTPTSTPTDLLADLAEQGARIRNARQEEADARNKVAPLIVEARKQGLISQQEAIAMSTLSRETVRGIERAGGIDAPRWAARTPAHIEA